MSDEPLVFGTGGDWLLVHTDPHSGTQTYIQDLQDGHTAIKKVTPINNLLDSAADSRAASAGRKWGDGQVIGTLPLSVYFGTGYAEAKANHDHAWIKRFWSDPDHKHLRTKEGKL